MNYLMGWLLLLCSYVTMQAQQSLQMTITTDNSYRAKEDKNVYMAVQIKATTVGKRLPLNLTILYNRTHETDQEAVEKLIDQLQPEDCITLIGMSNEPELLCTAVPATDKKKLKKILTSKVPKWADIDVFAQFDFALRTAAQHYKEGVCNELICLHLEQYSKDRAAIENIFAKYPNAANIGITVFEYGYCNRLASDITKVSNGDYTYDDKKLYVDKNLEMLALVASLNTHLQINFSAQDLRALQVYGQYATIKSQSIEIDLRNIRAGEERTIMIEFEAKHDISQAITISANLSYYDVAKDGVFMQTVVENIYPCAIYTDCQQSQKNNVIDQVLLHKTNLFLELLMDKASQRHFNGGDYYAMCNDVHGTRATEKVLNKIDNKEASNYVKQSDCLSRIWDKIHDMIGFDYYDNPNLSCIAHWRAKNYQIYKLLVRQGLP